MGEVERDNGAAYLRALGRVARRARLAVVMRRLVAGSLAGSAAGFAYLAARPFLPPSFTLVNPLVVPGLLLAAGGLAGAGVGCAVRIHRTALAVQADRSLGTPGLASAALELAEGRRASAFANPLLEDAASGLRSAGPRRILGRTRLRLLPWALAAAAVVAVTGLLPWNLRDLFPARPPVDRRIAVLGEELEESGRRLEEETRRLDLREGLELSRELQSLGKDLQVQEGSPEELSRRLSELERRIGSEYELMLQRFREQQQPGGAGAGDGTASGGGDAEMAPGSGQGDAGNDASRDAPEAVDPSTLPPEAQELAEARDLLRQLRERSASSSGSGAGSEGGGSPGDREGAGEGTAAAGGDEAAGVDGDPSASPEAGTSPVADEPGAPSEIAASKPGEPLAAESVVGEGEMARMLVRALPEATGAATAEEQVLGQYRKQAENALAAEQVPLELREYVKGYFTGIGVLQ